MNLPVSGDLLADRYRVEAPIGQGSMAVVFRARDESTGELCALKIIHPHLAENPQVAALFQREAEAASRIGASPHVVRVLSAGTDHERGLPFIVMELLTGRTLDHVLKSDGALPLAKARELLLQIADALDRAHAADVIHRDLKPANLFLTRGTDGATRLVVVDFGIAKILEGDVNATATQVGSPAYAAPEQLGATIRALAAKDGVWIASGVSAGTDVWALGLVAFEMLTGLKAARYWGAEGSELADLIMQIGLGNPPLASVRAGDQRGRLPVGFDAWLGRCLRKSAADRWRGAGEAVRALFQLVDDEEKGDNEPTIQVSSRQLLQMALGPRQTVVLSPSGREARAGSAAAEKAVQQLSSSAAWRPGPALPRRTLPLSSSSPEWRGAPPVIPAPRPTAEAPPVEVANPGPQAGADRRPDEPLDASLGVSPPGSPWRAVAALLAVLSAGGVAGAAFYETRGGQLKVYVTTAGGTSPREAEVFIDGVRVCSAAPCVLSGITPGVRTIRAAVPGLPLTEPVQHAVIAGEESVVTIAIHPAIEPPR